VVDISESTAATVIDGLTISGGQADGEDEFRINRTDGAGLYGNENASAKLSNLIIEDNLADGDGGGLYLGEDSSPTISNVSFLNNSASDNGGAIYFDRGGNLDIDNSVFSGNQSQSAGGIDIQNGIDRFNVTNSTFYDNEGNTSDDIVDASGRGNSTSIVNNIFWNSAAIERPQVSIRSIFIRGNLPETTNFSNNILKGSIPSFQDDIDDERDVTVEGNLTDDPLFVDAAAGDFRLQADSPGVDAGNDEVVNNDATDVARNPRFNDEVDIGAYEYGLYLSIDDVRILEGDTGSSDAEFTVTLFDALDLAPTDEVTVEYTSLDRNAKGGFDFEDVTGTLTFDEDTATQTISVPITGDTRAEFSEAFNVSIRNPTGGAIITDDLALGIIQNDDQLPAGVESDRFFASDVDASFYTPSASEREEVLTIIPELELDGADGIAFLLEPTSPAS